MEIKEFEPDDLGKLWKPAADSHKGENGRVLVIGGSKLFHSSIFWSADAASRVVDLVHFTSPANENNEVVRKRIKEGFWSGIVVDWSEVDSYVQEDDSILIGPGMSRVENSEAPSTKYQLSSKSQIQNSNDENNEDVASLDPSSVKQVQDDIMESGELVDAGKKDDTKSIVNALLVKYPEKRWVVDGGALQEVDPSLLNENMIITPHVGELRGLADKVQIDGSRIAVLSTLRSAVRDDKSGMESLPDLSIEDVVESLSGLSDRLSGVTVLAKNIGGKDLVVRDEAACVISGGNEGLTKGGTGDVLAGLTAALYAKNDSVLAASAASYLEKRAADELKNKVGTFYNAADVIEAVGKVYAKALGGA